MADGTAQKVEQLTTHTEEQLRQELTALGVELTVSRTTLNAHWLYPGEQRLDASYYANEAFTAQRVVHDCGYEVKNLGQVVREIFILGRFRRIYATDKDAGWPYLSASETLTFRPQSDRLIAKDHAPKEAEWHFARRGWLLVSCSGSVGRITLATKRLEPYFLTHDLARLIPNQSPLAGYLYAFLASWMGQALLSKDQYGSAIKHLETHHIAGIPIPLLPETEQRAIHDKILRAYELRDEANELLDEANQRLHQELGLPLFDERLVPYLPSPADQPTNTPDLPHPRAFEIQASALDDRFDASYHVPVARTVVALLNKGIYPARQLGQLAGDILIPPRFKRIYVSKEHGVPFLQGSHLPQMRPYDLKYLSRTKTHNLDRWVIHKEWVLVTCSGTIGRVGLVSSAQDQWAASQHLLRIIPDKQKGHPGYIAAFLMTPYGQHQLMAKIYGGVVDELTEADTASIWIPDAPLNIQAAIGELVIAAFEKKDQASAIEEAAIAEIEAILSQSR